MKLRSIFLIAFAVSLVPAPAKAASWDLVPIFIHNPDQRGDIDFRKPILDRWSRVLETAFGANAPEVVAYQKSGVNDAIFTAFAEQVDEYMNRDNIVSGAEISEYLVKTGAIDGDFFLSKLKQFVFEPATRIPEWTKEPVVVDTEPSTYLCGGLDLLSMQNQGAKVIGSAQVNLGTWSHTVWQVDFSALNPGFVRLLRRQKAFEPLILYVRNGREQSVSECGIMNDLYSIAAEFVSYGRVEGHRSHFRRDP
jgi:hypothetical protein